MKSSYQIKKISFLTLLGLGVHINANAVEIITSADCGSTLMSNTDYELSENLSCSGSALSLLGDSTNLSLGGFTIEFSGGGTPPDGIIINGDNITISGPGTITGFNNNISLSYASSNNIIEIVNLDAVSRGVSLIYSEQNTIDNNTIVNSGSQGIGGVESNNNNFERNSILNSSGDGIYLFSAGINPTNSDDNNITYNIISNAGSNGIFLESQALTSTSNNNVNFNFVMNPNQQAISLLTSGGFTQNNVIQYNFVLNNINDSPAFSDCTEQTNDWGLNLVNYTSDSGIPPCITS